MQLDYDLEVASKEWISKHLGFNPNLIEEWIITHLGFNPNLIEQVIGRFFPWAKWGLNELTMLGTTFLHHTPILRLVHRIGDIIIFQNNHGRWPTLGTSIATNFRPRLLM